MKAGKTNAKHEADSGNDSTNEMLQKEKRIDPGNEHHHQNQADGKMPGVEEPRKKHDANAGGDSSGTSGSDQPR